MLSSLRDFAWGIVRRWFFWAPTFLLDPFDYYERYLKAKLPAQYQLDLTLPGWAFPWVLCGGLVLAAYATYHELHARVGLDRRRIALATLLGNAFTQGETLMLSTDQQAIEAWATRVTNLTREAFGDAEAATFASNVGFVFWGGTNLRNFVDGRLRRLDSLIQRLLMLVIRADFDLSHHEDIWSASRTISSSTKHDR